LNKGRKVIKLTKATIVTFVLSLTTIHANNSSEHSHHDEKNHNSLGHSCRYDKIKNEVSKETVETAAKKEVQNLVAKKKIHKSWKSVPISKIGKTHYGDTDDWVVGFDNMKIKNKKRQTLYIFVSVRGEIRGANYTGN